ncbi:MAG: acetyl-CoA carboxylase biotin carboxylase subunit family protein [Candidatus Cryptobacteroides sp.]
MNFVFISPNFPETYWIFCDRLHASGVNVLGIGDAAYDSLDVRLRASLTEYYRVDSLEVYDEVFRAVAYFSFKYGKIDWLESNNEYWLRQDARLRADFNIVTGPSPEEIHRFTSKAEMKKFYAAGGVPTARQHRVKDLASAEAFISETGYPVIVKPEVGVGAAATYRISSREELKRFFTYGVTVPYVMEEFITGDIYSYDAILDSHGRPLFESSAKFPPSVMDIVIKGLDLMYYVLPEVPEGLRRLGRATAEAFGVESRFVHFEFFRLTEAKPGLGEIGDFVGLEVNMRPAGGYTPDMMDFAHSTDVYRIWADMVVHDRRLIPESGEDHYCIYYGRRDDHVYLHSHQEVMEKYGSRMAMCARMPEVLSPDMGNQMYTVHAWSDAERDEFLDFVSAEVR